jgi:glyoxylase-like metal-dependent hydrolase (beta-lactamase superfamily II)
VAARRRIDAMVVTHGDADLFAGLSNIREPETEAGSAAHKRLFIHPERVFHNGLVKRPILGAGAGAAWADEECRRSDDPHRSARQPQLEVPRRRRRLRFLTEDGIAVKVLGRSRPGWATYRGWPSS